MLDKKLLAAGAALVLFSGLVYGLWTDRWHSPDALVKAVARVNQVPLTVGSWQGQNLGPPAVNPAAFAKAGAQGYWMRRYVNTQDGRAVTAILMCGRHADIAVHAPEICYTASGFDMVESPAAFVLKPGQGLSTPAEFRTGEFATAGTEPSSKRLRIFWSWNATGEWLAPAGDARWTFRGAPFLYKLYVVDENARRDGPPESDPCVALLRVLVPELQKTLFLSAIE
jgi:hypothetical protein